MSAGAWKEISEREFPQDKLFCLCFPTDEENKEAAKNLKFYRNNGTGEYRAYTCTIRNSRMKKCKILIKGDIFSYSFTEEPYLVSYSRLPINTSRPLVERKRYDLKKEKPPRGFRVEEPEIVKDSEYFYECSKFLQKCEKYIGKKRKRTTK